MSLKEEFEKLVKEANDKLHRENRDKDFKEAMNLRALQLRQKKLVKILRQNLMSENLDISN